MSVPMSEPMSSEPLSADRPFEEIVEQLSSPLRHYLERFSGDTQTADDLLQETLIKIAKGLPDFKGRSSLKTWAFSVATRTAIDHLRKSRSSSRIVIFEDADAPDPTEQIGERLVIDEMNSCIRDEIDTLPGDYRAAIALHDLEGLTAAETAAIVGCSIATAKIRIHRARARLKVILQRDCTFYRDAKQVFRCDRKDPEESQE